MCKSFVERNDLSGLGFPCEVANRVGSLRAQLPCERTVAQDRQDAVRHFVRIPKIHGESMPDDFGCSRLFADDDRDTMSDGFERHQPEWFGK